MEIFRFIKEHANMRVTKKGVVNSGLSTALILTPACSFAPNRLEPSQSKTPELKVTASCSTGHEYASTQLGNHIDINLNASGFSRTSPRGGYYLLAIDSTQHTAPLVVGYEGNSDGIRASMHAGINSIRGQGRIDFVDGHTLKFIVVKGQQNEDIFRVTQEVASKDVSVDCVSGKSSNL